MRPGGVAELSLAVFEGSEACGRTSKGGKATWGKASQRFGDRTGDVLGVLNPPTLGMILFFGYHQRNQPQTRHPEE